MAGVTQKLKYFRLAEFDSQDSPGSGSNMQDETLRKLELARDIAGIPFVITSGFRTVEHNASIGGVSGSAHTRGFAADIGFSNESQALRIVTALTRAGFERIGLSLGNRFVHADDDPDKSPAYWSYGPYMPYVA